MKINNNLLIIDKFVIESIEQQINRGVFHETRFYAFFKDSGGAYGKSRSCFVYLWVGMVT
ncbi:hypothetical protein J1TS1_00740 [Shouchella clausii]|nr:hypothetical protein J1TS1_00740 [Shouchella clausii]